MPKLLAILIAGGVGTLCRYGLGGLVQRSAGGLFPVGTLVVNAGGCLVIGLLGAYFAGPQLVREEVRLAVLVGLLGGFTTFSSFAWETISFLNDGQWAKAAANVALQNGLGLLACWVGYRGGIALFGA